MIVYPFGEFFDLLDFDIFIIVSPKFFYYINTGF